MYNTLAFCVLFNIGCDAYDGAGFTEAEQTTGFLFVTQLFADLETITGAFDGKGELTEDPDEVTNFIAHLKELPSQAWKVDFHFSKEFSVDNQVSQYSRAIMFWGFPLSSELGGASESKTETKRKDFIMDELFKTMEKYAGTGYNKEINAYYFMSALINDVFIAILANDGTFAMLSIAFVYFYMRFMLQSWFLANIGFLEIVLSIPLAWFTAVKIFGIKYAAASEASAKRRCCGWCPVCLTPNPRRYFSSLNPLCLFIVAAIGADDIFVFMDAYKQSAFKGASIVRDLPTRMSYVYRRAGTAMLITSATTCSAFLCCFSSPLAMTKSFGLFAAFVILFDYLLVMTMFCTGVVVYHDYFESPDVNCCAQCACVCCPLGCSLCVPAIAKERTTTELAKARPEGETPKQDR
jgi:hypothetical protein